VLTAADGREAVSVFSRHLAQVSHVILDLTMPHQDGMAACDEIARLKPGVKVILSSGYSEPELAHRICGRGLAGFIQKPYSLEALRCALRNAGALISAPPPSPPAGG
jgi:DNA-binding NtrC family response regulator